MLRYSYIEINFLRTRNGIKEDKVGRSTAQTFRGDIVIQL